MPNNFYFYDLETSGFNPRKDRIMQFGGQRTDEQLNPIGKPDCYYIKMTSDILPDPGAVLVTGITPQRTIHEGISEAEFLKLFHEKIALPGTIFTGYNSIRFDDEFLRYAMYRNFYDPYEWQWGGERTKWDLLDLIRMTRALRPAGIEWPFDSDGKPSNRLELICKANNLKHYHAHSALGDVEATIALAKMTKAKQPKLFSYLLGMRKKSAIEELVNSDTPFVYSSGKYPSEYEKTAVVGVAAKHPTRQGVLVFDLRFDPNEFANKPAGELVKLWQERNEDGSFKLPVKSLLFNRCPAVAPLGVVDEPSQKRLGIDLSKIQKHFSAIQKSKIFAENLRLALQELDEQRAKLFSDEKEAEQKLYDSFVPDADKPKMQAVRAAEPHELGAGFVKFQDKRLQELLPRYKARNYPDALSPEEQAEWEEYRAKVLTKGKEKSRLAQFGLSLQEKYEQRDLSDEQKYLLEELRLWGETVIPI